MIPRNHFFVSLGVSLLLLPFIPWYYLIVIIAANVLIDFDHYMIAVIRNNGDCRLSSAYKYYEHPGKFDFHMFHTIEAHLLILAMSYLNIIFFYVFLGMVLHSLTDFIPLAYTHRINEREYFFYRWWKNVRQL